MESEEKPEVAVEENKVIGAEDESGSSVLSPSTAESVIANSSSADEPISTDSAIASSEMPTNITTDGSSSVSETQVDDLAAAMSKNTIDDTKTTTTESSESTSSSSSAVRQTSPPIPRPQASSTSPSVGAVGKTSPASSGASSSGRATTQAGANQPVMKKQLAYQQQDFCERPERMICQSTLGFKFPVEANYFRIRCNNVPIIHQYDFQFAKLGRQGEMPMNKREDTLLVFWQGVKQHYRLFPDAQFFVYNGVNMLYSTQKLKDDAGTWKLKVDLDRKEYVMVIKYAKSIRLEPNPQTVTQETELITILDEVFSARIRNHADQANSRFVQVGRSTFFVPDRNMQYDVRLNIPVGEGLEVWTGLHGAVKPRCQLGMLLNVDLGHSLFHRQDYNLVKFFLELIARCTFDDKGVDGAKREFDRICPNTNGMSLRGRKLLEEAVKGVTLTYRCPGNSGKEKAFKYSSVAHKAASVHLITLPTGEEVSIVEYYRRYYGYELTFPNLPCIQLNKKRSFVPMELVYTDSRATKLKGKIPDGALRKMVQKTAFHPLERKEIICQLAASDGTDPNKPMFLAEQDTHMKNFGVSVDRQFVECRATLLPEPRLQFGKFQNGEHIIEILNHQGEWSLSMPEHGTLKKAHIEGEVKVVPMMLFLNEVKHDVGPLATLMMVLHHFGLTIPGGPQAFDVYKFPQQPNWDEIYNGLSSFKQTVAQQFPGAIPLAIFVFPYKCTTHRQLREDYISEYAMIKYICDVKVGLHCQGILEKTWGQCIGNPLTCSTAHNVAIKIMGKIGVSLHKLLREANHKNWTRFTNPEEPTLVLGIDVTHPGMLDRKQGGHAALSVACVVGNIDLDCSKFETSVRAQLIGEERTFSLEAELKERIVGFLEKTGKRPSHVVVYRDGVSETQFKEVLYEEKNAFETACRELHPDYKPTLTYIVLTKRHHTRFFPKHPSHTHGKAFNLKPGTLIESEVTSTNYFDFFLLSQHGPLGTSRPGHYYVLWDDWKPSSAFWQTITHCLAYNYVRCPKSISQPAPIMYAHLAAKRAKDYLMAHYARNSHELRRMSDYEQVMDIKMNGNKMRGLPGMVFV